MYLAYFDEAGDDGFPEYSSPLFVLTSLYVHFSTWKSTYETICKFRKMLKRDFNIPVNQEFHTKYFFTNKSPYREMNLNIKDRLQIIDLYCQLIAYLDIKIVNVVINKKQILTPEYPVLDRALTYSVQRIENDLNQIHPEKRFMIITDPGREGKMRKTTRRIQRINFIPSKYNQEAYRKEIKSLIEDPLPKHSGESYFIQLSDFVSYIVYMYSLLTLDVGKLGNRIPEEVNLNMLKTWLDKISDSLNLKATGDNKYGIVCYPK